MSYNHHVTKITTQFDKCLLGIDALISLDAISHDTWVNLRTNIIETKESVFDFLRVLYDDIAELEESTYGREECEPDWSIEDQWDR